MTQAKKNSYPTQPRRSGNGVSTHQPPLNSRAHRYITESLSQNTLRAIRSDLKVYMRAGGVLPGTVSMVANFLSDQIALGKRPSTIERYAHSLHTWHHMRGAPSPVHSVLVQQVMKGIRRTENTRPQSAPALLYKDFKRMLDALQGPGLHSARDRAMFSLAYFGAFRRSEVVALRVEDLDFHQEGVIVTLRSSKTNQRGDEETKAIRQRRHAHGYCPVALVRHWIRRAELHEGPLFPRIGARGQLSSSPIRAETFYRRMRAATRAAGLPSHYSPHSLRAGYITEAYRRGASLLQIKRISGHRHQPTLERYIHLDAFATTDPEFFEE